MATLSTGTPTTPLRQRMLDDMAMRAMKSRTQHDYVRHVRAFAAFLGRSPDYGDGRGYPTLPGRPALPRHSRHHCTQLAEAGATPSEIAAMLGWTVTTVNRMLDTYQAMTASLSDSAVAKLRQRHEECGTPCG